MKLTKSKLKQLIKEELNEMSAWHFAGDDIAAGLAHDAAAAVVNTQTVKNELAELSREDASMLDQDVRNAVYKIIKNYLKPDVAGSAGSEKRRDQERREAGRGVLDRLQLAKAAFSKATEEEPTI